MANVTELLLRLAAGAVPVPLKVRVCGLPTALSATDTVALRGPVAEGANVTAMVQVAPTATVPVVRQSVPLAGVANAKSAGFVPVKVTPVIVSDVAALLVSTEVIWPLVVPTR